MDLHAVKYFSPYSDPGPSGNFHQVIPLHDDPLLEWTDAQKMAPELCRGWYELAQLSVQDRIEFTRDFWLGKMPYHPNINRSITNFFASVDDVGIFLTQKKEDDFFIPHIVYSLADDSGFFHGESGASDVEIIRLQKEFPTYILPADYLAFLKIHNGFAKLTDTGLIPSTQIKEAYQDFQKMNQEGDVPITTIKGASVNPESLIPFYESFGMPFYQCFWGEWYPDQEMGNVYYSALARIIVPCDKQDESGETLAFQTFTDWLLFYLEKIE